MWTLTKMKFLAWLMSRLGVEIQTPHTGLKLRHVDLTVIKPVTLQVGNTIELTNRMTNNGTGVVYYSYFITYDGVLDDGRIVFGNYTIEDTNEPK